MLAKKQDQRAVKIQAEQKLLQSKRKRLPKPPKQFAPISLEKSYFREIRSIVKALQGLIKDVVIENLEAIQYQANISRPKFDSTREDAVMDYIESLFERIRVKFAEKYTKTEFKNIATRQGRNVDEFSYKQFNRTFGKVLGVNPIQNDSFLKDKMDMFAQTNADLIQSLAETQLKDVKTIVQVNAQKGTLYSDVAKQIQKKFKVTENKAKLIARDQTSKFNGALNQARQQEIGMNTYIWQTSGDERVRPMHSELDGKVFSWDDPPVTNENGDTNHPNFDYNCRCIAVPNFDELL